MTGRLERIDEGLWGVRAPMTFMGLRLGTRMTIVRLAGGELWLHSPAPLDLELKAEVDALGPVAHVVAPSLFHHVFAGHWASAYPGATLHGPAALAKKRKDLKLGAPLEEASRAGWASELAPLHVDGCMLDETVFIHARTRTLVTADLIENFATSPHWPTRAYLKAAGLYGTVGFSRMLRPVYRDRTAARRSLDALLERDFDRVVLAHGDVVERGGKAGIRESYAFLGG